MKYSSRIEEHEMGAGIMLLCKKKVLVLKRGDYKEDPFSGYWNFPGGTSEKGETPYETALRETFEETGFEERDIRIYEHIENRSYTMYIGVLDEEYMPVLDEEHAEYKWIPLSDVLKIENLHPKDERCFRRYIQKGRKSAF